MTPRSEAELAEAIAAAAGPLAVRGGGTRPVGRRVEGEILSAAGLDGITLYEPGALTLVARAGTPLAMIEDALAAENQRLPFEPMDHRPLLGTDGVPTIGGAVAANVSGPRRIQAGSCRDSLIGVRFVDGAGRVLKNGGRVMKNVTGYDLVKLMAGSRGTLGVLSEVSFKVLPVPEATATLRLAGLSPARAVAALSAALTSPFEVSGAAHSPVRDETLIRVEGFAESVAYRGGRLADLLGRFGDITVEEDPARAGDIWRRVRDVTDLADRTGDVWRISVRPGDGPRIAAALGEVPGGAECLYDWGGGLIWAQVAQGADIRPTLAQIPGHATLVRAGEDTRRNLAVFPPEPAPLAAISAGLRAKFDPRGILNPGLMG
ncbi:FAD-binding protein [Tropicimonas sp.]|uniref:FAD-binding protein n=1 Tax=Tropicimonas sp. TaxID=2067044 RepID=UPI003A874C73